MAKNIRGSIFLLATAIIWGFAFVAQSEGMENIGPLTFQASRMTLAALFLCPMAIISRAIRKRKTLKENPDKYTNKQNTKKLFLTGAVCGVLLFLASAFQQTGILYTGVGHAGFITASYILLVPIFELIFFKKKVPVKIWFCVIAALIGMYLLCMTEEGFRMSFGDLLILICAVLFSFHIIAVDKLAYNFDGIEISAIQMSVAAILSLISMFIFEKPVFSDIISSWIPIVYAGILSCGVAYTFQIIGQKYTSPAAAAIIMSFESVFAVIGGAIILSERLSIAEIAGCIFMFAAIIVSELPAKTSKQR